MDQIDSELLAKLAEVAGKAFVGPNKRGVSSPALLERKKTGARERRTSQWIKIQRSFMAGNGRKPN